MNWPQNRDGMICHASGLVRDGRCLAMLPINCGPWKKSTTSALTGSTAPDPALNLRTLDVIDVFEANGGLDFDALSQHRLDELIGAKQ